MEIKVIIDDANQLEIAFFGKLDTLGVGEVETKVYALLNGVSKQVYFDFAEVSYLSSMGIRLIISAMRMTKRAECSLLIINANESVRKVLEMINMDEVIR